MKKLSESIQEIASPEKKNAKGRDQRKGNPQANWLRGVKDIAYEIDDILQIFSLKNGSHEISARRSSTSSKMRDLQDRKANTKLVQELKAIRTRLNRILKKQTVQCHHHPSSTDQRVIIKKMAISNCPVEPIAVSGKDEEFDKNMIIGLLLSATEITGPCMIPIDRKGGAGTTKLARAILDDERVTGHFDRKVWVPAAEIVDPLKLTRLISKPASTLFWVHKTLNQNSEEKQVLMILDDVRNKNIFRNKSIVEDKAYKFMTVNAVEDRLEFAIGSYDYPPSSASWWRNLVYPHSERLSFEESLKLFTERTFKRRVDVDDNRRRRLESIGRDIMKNLGGFPRTVVSAFADMLSIIMEPSYWKLILESNVWQLPVDEEAVLPTLAESCYMARVKIFRGSSRTLPHRRQFMARFPGSKSGGGLQGASSGSRRRVAIDSSDMRGCERLSIRSRNSIFFSAFSPM